MATPTGSVFALDVECVATGTRHDARAVAQIGIVNWDASASFVQYVMPKEPVISCLTDLTGVTMERLVENGASFEEAVANVRAFLPEDAVLVGHNILKDVAWLGLTEGQDFRSMVDLAGLTRAWNPRFNSWTVFSQDHVVRHALGWDLTSQHDALGDAVKSLHVYWRYAQLAQDPDERQRVDQLLLAAPRTPTFSVQHPSYDGVCMGNRRTCTCGASFVFS